MKNNIASIKILSHYLLNAIIKIILTSLKKNKLMRQKLLISEKTLSKSFSYFVKSKVIFKENNHRIINQPPK